MLFAAFWKAASSALLTSTIATGRCENRFIWIFIYLYKQKLTNGQLNPTHDWRMKAREREQGWLRITWKVSNSSSRRQSGGCRHCSLRWRRSFDKYSEGWSRSRPVIRGAKIVSFQTPTIFFNCSLFEISVMILLLNRVHFSLKSQSPLHWSILLVIGIVNRMDKKSPTCKMLFVLYLGWHSDRFSLYVLYNTV